MNLLAASAGPAGRRSPLLLVLFLALTLVVINVSNWIILSRVGESVETELGLRLSTVASSAVTTATPELLLASDVAANGFVIRVLEEISSHDQRARARRRDRATWDTSRYHSRGRDSWSPHWLCQAH